MPPQRPLDPGRPPAKGQTAHPRLMHPARHLAGIQPGAGGRTLASLPPLLRPGACGSGGGSLAPATAAAVAAVAADGSGYPRKEIPNGSTAHRPRPPSTKGPRAASFDATLSSSSSSRVGSASRTYRGSSSPRASPTGGSSPSRRGMATDGAALGERDSEEVGKAQQGEDDGLSEGEDCAAEDEDEDDDDFAAELEELSSLAQRLNPSAARGQPLSAGDMVDNRPATGGTSASASTTVPCGSTLSEAATSIEADDQALPAAAQGTAHKEGVSDNPLDFLSGAQRVHHELASVALPHGCRVECTPGSRAQFFFTLDVTEGPYMPATLTFWLKIFEDFPAPGSFSIRSTKKIFHPNITLDTRGLDVGSFMQDESAGGSSSSTSGTRGAPNGGMPQAGVSQRPYPFRDLLLEIRRRIFTPCDSPAANGDAAMLLQIDPDEFRRVVRTTLSGGYYAGVRFDQILCLGQPGRPSQEIVPAMPDDSHPDRPPIAENVRIGMMKIEVMKDDFKAQASAWQQQNRTEYQRLEASGTSNSALSTT